MSGSKLSAAELLQKLTEAAKAGKSGHGLEKGLLPPPPPPPPPPLPPMTLGQLLTPKSPSVKGLWYNKQVIKLDGWSFESCRFDNCRLVIETANFELKNCYLDASNEIEIKGRLVNVVKFLNLHGDLSELEEYSPIRNTDGTITVEF